MKKRPLVWVILIIVLYVGMSSILNIKVTTSQGINYQVSTIEIPLYLKLLDFLDRNYNYKWTVKKIIGNSKEEKDNVLKILKWTHENIKKTPQGYPIIDDHVWHIIVRGYGEDDQLSDVFATLCNFAGMDAFFSWISTEDNSSRIPLSFVNMNGKWSVLDPYRGIYFRNKKGNLADIEDILNGDWIEENIDNHRESDISYVDYLRNLSPVRKVGLKRANIQSPLNRLKYEIKKWSK